jgi:hypothetical protein
MQQQAVSESVWLFKASSFSFGSSITNEIARLRVEAV